MPMQALSRRGFLVACGAASAAWLAPAQWSRDNRLPALVVFDSRMPVSAEFARHHAASGVPLVDIATQDRLFWRTLRHDVAPRPGSRVDGICRWSDWVTVRGQFAAHRLRVRLEQQLADGSFAWSMA